jgi:hypothetical protein
MRTKKDMKPPRDVCLEQQRLLTAYEDAAAAYSAAVTDLRRNVEVLPERDYEMAYEESERLRLSAREAEEALHEHIRKHGC